MGRFTLGVTGNIATGGRRARTGRSRCMGGHVWQPWISTLQEMS